MTRSTLYSALATLRDNVLMAIDRRESGVVSEGLDVYEDLIITIIDEESVAQAAAGEALTSAIPLGREWHATIRDLHGIIDAVSASPSRILWIDTISWIRKIAVICLHRKAYNAMGMVLTLLESAWDEEMVAPAQDTAQRQDALLLRLSEIGLFQLSQDEVSDAGRLVYSRTFLRIIRSAIDSNNVEAATVSIEYFLYGKDSSKRDGLDRLTSAGLIAILAWILYRIDHGYDLEKYLDRLRPQFSASLHGSDSVLSVLYSSDRLENELGIDWWELADRGPMSSGVIEIGSYMTLALIAVGREALTAERIDPSSDEQVHAARRLLSAIESVEQDGFIKSKETLGLNSSSLSDLKAHLLDSLKENELLAEQGYAQAPLNPIKISDFRKSVEESLRVRREESLMGILLARSPSTRAPLARRSQEGDDSSLEEQGDQSPNFGVDVMIPRWYFADTEVLADPVHLAQELVDSLVRGEDDLILNSLAPSTSTAPPTELSDLNSLIGDAISRENLYNPIVVTNSYQAYMEVAGVTIRDANLQTGPPAAVVHRVYDDREPFVILMSPKSVSVRHPSPSPELTGDEVLEGLSLVLGVCEISSEELKVMLADSESDISRARLSGSLRVRLLERLEVAAGAESARFIWALPKDCW